MLRSHLVPGLLVAAVAFSFAQSATDRRVDRLLKDILIVDTHIDTPGYILDEGYRLGEEHRYYETDVPRLRRGHVGAVFFGVYATPHDFPQQASLTRALGWIDALREEVRQNPRDLQMAYTAGDIESAQRAGRIAALLGLEGGHLIQNDMRLLRTYYRLGVRYMTLTHFKNNEWADAYSDVAVHNGLTPFGRDIVREMNRMGMMVDVSHVSDKTFYDAVGASRAPVIASHSALRAVCDIPRNLDDDMLRAMARKGGVVFIAFHVAFLDAKVGPAYKEALEQRDREMTSMMAANKDNPRRWELKREIQARCRARLPKVDYTAVLRHINHAVKVAGADCVGLGSDFDGISGLVPEGLEDVSKYPILVRGLVELGYSDSDIRKIMGGNLLRVMRAVETTAIQAGSK